MWRLPGGKCSWIILGSRLRHSDHCWVYYVPPYLARAAAKIILIAALLFCVGYYNEEPKTFILLCSQSWAVKRCVGEDSSCPHFLHVKLIKRPITCRSHLSVQWAVNSPLTNLQDFVTKAIRSLGSVYKGLCGSRGSRSWALQCRPRRPRDLFHWAPWYGSLGP
jgi:hypothetical protein